MDNKSLGQSAEEFARNILAATLEVILDDYTWQYFGYNGCPKRGRLFNNSIDKRELEKETFLLREFFICAIASALEPLYKFNNINRGLYISIGYRVIDLILSHDLIFESFRFDSDDDAYNYLVSSLNDYLFKDYDDFSTIFTNRVEDICNLDTKENNTFLWFAPVTLLFKSDDSAMKLLRNVTKQHYMSDIIDDIDSDRVRDSVILYHNHSNQNIEEKLSEKLRITNELNNKYCDIYDSLMNQKIGYSVNYKKLLNELNTIKNSLIQEIEECRYIFAETIDEKNLIKLLIDYQELLNNRIEALQIIISKLNDKAEGIGEKYSFGEYKKDINYLNGLEKQVDTMGKELQDNATIYLQNNHKSGQSLNYNKSSEKKKEIIIDNDIQEKSSDNVNNDTDLGYDSQMLKYKKFVLVCNIIFIVIALLPLINGIYYFATALGGTIYFYVATIVSIIINTLWYFKLKKQEENNFVYLLFIPIIMHGYAIKKFFNAIIGGYYLLSGEIETLNLEQYMYDLTLSSIAMTKIAIVKDVIFILLLFAIILSYLIFNTKNNKKKRNIIIIAVICIVLSIIIFWNQYQIANQESFTINLNSSNLVNMKCPEGWIEVDYSSQGIELAFINSQNSEAEYFSENINLIIEDLSENMMDLETYTIFSINALKNYIEDFKLIEITECYLGDYNAIKIIYTGNYDTDYIKYILQYMAVYTIVDNKAYIVTYTSLPSQFSKYLDVVEESLNSFEIK